MTKDETLRLALGALENIDRAMPFPVAKLAIKECKAALEAKDEPVTENGMYRLGYHNGYGFGEAYGKANAPQRKPLTIGQIMGLAIQHGDAFNFEVGFARAIEAAHGIKGET